MRCTRRVISSAARRETWYSRRSGSAPSASKCATRCASVLVLPVPAPAMTKAVRWLLAKCHRSPPRAGHRSGRTDSPEWPLCGTGHRKQLSVLRTVERTAIVGGDNSSSGSSRITDTTMGSSHSGQIRYWALALSATSKANGSIGLWQCGQMKRGVMAVSSNTVIIYSIERTASVIPLGA